MRKTIHLQECCYLSTPKHIRSFTGRFIYIYTAKGQLSLNLKTLTFTSKKVSFDIPVNLIKEIKTGHYARTAKPIRLDYIAVKYDAGGKDETILLTPTRSWAASVWATNKMVASWKELLDQAIHDGLELN